MQLHVPHFGASAVPVEVIHGSSLPGSQNISLVTATASLKGKTSAVTIINRHFDQQASVSWSVPSSATVKQAQVLAVDEPHAQNSAQHPDRVKPAPLQVYADGTARWHIELPAHSMATIVLE